MSHPRTINRRQIKKKFFELIEYDLDKLGEHEFYTVCETCRDIQHINNSVEDNDGSVFPGREDGVKIWKALYDRTEPVHVDIIVRMDNKTRYYCSEECMVTDKL